MGAKSHLTPGEFSQRFNMFLARVVQERLGGRPTARWAEVNMPSDRKKDYWDKILKAEQAMTTEDISVVAAWLGVSPFTFVRAVRDDDLDVLDVGGIPHDELLLLEEEWEGRKEDQTLAAKRGRRKAEQQGE